MVRNFLRYVSLVFETVPSLFRSRCEQTIVELALRQQLAVYSHKHPRPHLAPIDRAFWVALARLWPCWKSSLVIVKPETVVAWHRKGFRLYWRSISKRGPGRSPISTELRDLIRRLARENSWRARRIQAELEKLGFNVSLATVSRYLPKRLPRGDQHQRWMTFLQNHRDIIAAMDFVVVPTVRFKLLYIWFAVDHGRREFLHFNVTEHPTAAWVGQQLREAFPGDSRTRFLIHDNDSIFADQVVVAIGKLGMQSRPTSLRSPWQNGVAERWAGTIRRELPDHVVVIDEDHLRRMLREYVDYYNRDRVHTRLRDAPNHRGVENRPSSAARVIGLPRVGGLHHRYSWSEAA